MPFRCCHVLWDESSSFVYTEITKHPDCSDSHDIHGSHHQYLPSPSSSYFSHKCYDYEWYKRYKCYVGALVIYYRLSIGEMSRK